LGGELKVNLITSELNLVNNLDDKDWLKLATGHSGKVSLPLKIVAYTFLIVSIIIVIYFIYSAVVRLI
jgi:hypothetical protein